MLALPARESHASLADSRRITLWQTVDYKLIYVGDFGSALHGFLIHFLGAHTKGDVGRHTVVREVNLLWHIANSALPLAVVVVIGCPSMLKSPSCGSSRASITSTIVVLPLPVAPTKPTVQCAVWLDRCP